MTQGDFKFKNLIEGDRTLTVDHVEGMCRITIDGGRPMRYKVGNAEFLLDSEEFEAFVEAVRGNLPKRTAA